MDTATLEIVGVLVKETITGGLLVLCLFVIRHLQAKRDAEHQARLDDQKTATTALLAMSDKTHAALDKVAEVMEVVRQQPAQPSRANLIGTRTQR